MYARFPTRIASIITLFFPRHLKSDQRGFSLLETVMALGLLVFSSTATLSLFVQTAGVIHTAKYSEISEGVPASRCHQAVRNLTGENAQGKLRGGGCRELIANSKL